MTKRERYLAALHNQLVDELVWAPNFDYWLHVSTAEDTLPRRYRGMSRNDIVRAVGGSLWNRTGGAKAVLDPRVKQTWHEQGETWVHEVQTPLGAIRQVSRQAEGPHRTKALTEHFVKDLESLQVLKYVVEATHYEPDYAPVAQALRETGDDGVVLSGADPVPFIQFAKTDAGYLNAFYLWTDSRKEVDTLIAAYTRLFLERIRILAGGPADVIAMGDNMDGATISPAIFREYAVPFYQEARKLVKASGKIFESHWCGHTETLLPLVPGCGLDVVEAIVTRPMARLGLSEALDLLRGEAVLQGGIPSVLVCRETCTDKEFEAYIRNTIVPLHGRKGFILGMSDNVPPNADFTRVEAVAGWLGAGVSEANAG
ncbi:MAG: uroporphyrinogen decarboxylase family protein [Planctomycetota bacterium]